MRLALTVACAALVGLLPLAASAQSVAEQSAFDYLRRDAARHGLTAADVSDLVAYDQRTSSRSGVTAVYLHQQIGGVPVVAGQMTISLRPDGRVLHAAGRLVPSLAAKTRAGGASVSPSAAASALASNRGLAQTAPFVAVDQVAGSILLSDGGVSDYGVPARLVYTGNAAGQIVPAWEVGIYTLDTDHYWLGYVDAQTGAVIETMDLVVHDNFGGADGGAGRDAEATTVAPGVPYAARTADAPYFLAAPAQVPGYRVYAMPLESPLWSDNPATARTLVSNPSDATASPYGWHDTDGADGAEFTITRGNNVFAYPDVDDNDAPDATGVPDGGASLTFDFPVDLTANPSTYKEAATTNLFYWSNIIHDVTYRYGFDEAAGNFQQNNYGRGGVTFDDAVAAEAQDASNGSGNCNANFYTPTDAGAGPLGPRPRMQMYTCDRTVGPTVPGPDNDGDLDAGVILHEYGHGISNRLTGGPGNRTCLQNAEQMGEGWSDYFGLMLTMDADDTAEQRRPIGNHLLGQPRTGQGIRGTFFEPSPGAPYSTDFAVNSATYGDTNGGLSQPHGIGFVWATILWEMTWELIGVHGFSPDIYNADGTAGNQIAMSLVMEGMKLQPCSPGFVDGRNAILAADVALYDGAHTDLLWAAFARRGMGIGASQGSSASRSDQVEDFAEPETIAPDPVTDLAAIPNGDFVTLTFTASGDDGSVGTATSYDVRYSTSPIVTDADFSAATQATGEPTPQASGASESFVLLGLTFNTTYYVALKVTDNSFNISALSNVVQVTTLGAPVANIPTATIEAVVAASGDMTTATVTLGNTGPSDLRFSLSLSEVATRAPAPTVGEGTPAPEASKDAPESPTGADMLRGSGGPDDFGYSWIDSNEPGGPTYAWVDIAATGTALVLSDDDFETVALPFAFPFYGVDQTSVNIGSNGMVNFGTGSTAYFNTALPDTDTPNNLIAAFWDDLDPGAGNGTVYYQDMGDGRFVIQYDGVPDYPGPGAGAENTFEIILYPGGAIVFQYEDMNGDLDGSTVGIENADGTDGLQVAFDQAYVEDGLAVRFSALWVEADLSAGLVPAGGTTDVTLTFDATGLALGTYQAEMVVLTNDPTQPSVTIPITFEVGGVVAAGDPVEAFEGTHLLSQVFPNPAAAAARMTLAVAETQAVRVELYDALGRRVALAHDGELAARQATTIDLAPAGLAAGAYVVRVTGERFADTRRFTVTR